MKKLIIGLIIAISSSGSALAQKMTIVSATQQSWSGGVAGHYGTNYCIMLKVEKDKIGIDSLYINSEVFVPNVRLQGMAAVGKDTTERTYCITAEESHDENIGPPFRNTETKTSPVSHRSYKGQALIIYELNGKKHELAVKQLTALEGIAYP